MYWALFLCWGWGNRLIENCSPLPRSEDTSYVPAVLCDFFMLLSSFLLLLLEDRVSLCNSLGCPRTRSVDQADLEGLRGLPASAYRRLGLMVCATKYGHLMCFVIVNLFNLYDLWQGRFSCSSFPPV